MRLFNKDDFDKVSKYEKDFQRAIDSRYCTGLTQEELDTCKVIYKETLNRQANLSCGACILQMMTSVGRLYFAFKDKQEKDKKNAKSKKNNKSISETLDA